MSKTSLRTHTAVALLPGFLVRPRQHSIGYMGDGFYRSKDPTNSIRVLKERIVQRNQTYNKQT